MVLRKICDIQIDPENSLIKIIFDGEMTQKGEFLEYESEMLMKFSRNQRFYEIITWNINETNNF